MAEEKMSEEKEKEKQEEENREEAKQEGKPEKDGGETQKKVKEEKSAAQEQKPEKEEKKEEKSARAAEKKEKVAIRGVQLPISKKHSVYISRMIRRKPIDEAIAQLEQVVKMKQAVPFKGEVPHRKGRMSSGRYPVKAASYFIKLLKNLRGASMQAGFELEKTRIVLSSASWGRRFMRRDGRRAKRTNILLVAKEVS